MSHPTGCHCSHCCPHRYRMSAAEIVFWTFALLIAGMVIDACG